MEINVFAQTLFFFVASIAIIVVAVVFGVIGFHIIKIVRNLEIFSGKLNDATEAVKLKIAELSGKVSGLSFLSSLKDLFGFKNGKKGRNHNK